MSATHSQPPPDKAADALVERMLALRTRVQALVRERDATRRELAELREDNARLLAEQDAQRTALQALERRLQMAHLAQGAPASDEERERLKAAIGEMVRDIDKALASLNP